MSFPELLALILLCLGAWFWLDSLKAREAGVAAARAACAREGVQLLDETVVGRGLRLARDDNGRMVVRRAYDFEYSDSGDDRHRGAVVLLGREVVLLELASHHRNTVRSLF
ncbi:DUF3301 domain-containing protein [Azoarcus communis]|uniref:DUF3301 domain-containing protein n=1 Tax=Parazoarcus communis SWub3 = DSM 12120 TaxID=1121029 RepID=A0A323UR35_9RHOO|nr:DUF3301 domain-containing protein [Parazoarcus communis]NMG50469.1 DUF3301 domain-containing protein [Parazoarcus communis]NMG72119.1 DUF3301 domain-containing protein [Parazoarcus communis SWub3 = DSM 12120]PZA14691.1 DUF3301 domain-containing protein [Azoarcus communis] [Parazoarcus communis SWub3 = DSM 12120]